MCPSTGQRGLYTCPVERQRGMAKWRLWGMSGRFRLRGLRTPSSGREALCPLVARVWSHRCLVSLVWVAPAADSGGAAQARLDRAPTVTAFLDKQMRTCCASASSEPSQLGSIDLHHPGYPGDFGPSHEATPRPHGYAKHAADSAPRTGPRGASSAHVLRNTITVAEPADATSIRMRGSCVDGGRVRQRKVLPDTRDLSRYEAVTKIWPRPENRRACAVGRWHASHADAEDYTRSSSCRQGCPYSAQ